MPVLILTETELRACVGFDAQCLRATEDAFTWLSQGKVEMPPVMHIEVAEHRGDVDIKSACVRGLDHLAVKVASGFFENPKLGLPSGGAMVVVLNAKTGFCEAVMLDNAYLTDLRTGLAGAVAARYLAPETVRTVGVLGSGAQARYQVRALRLVRDFERALVSARDGGRPARQAGARSGGAPQCGSRGLRPARAVPRDGGTATRGRDSRRRESPHRARRAYFGAYAGPAIGGGDHGLRSHGDRGSGHRNREPSPSRAPAPSAPAP